MMKAAALGVAMLVMLQTAAAQRGKEIPRDTSFTIYNTAAKVQKTYPNARLVRPELAADCEMETDLVYASPGGRDLHLDIIMPSAKKTEVFPCVLIIHGGGWRSGSRQMEYPMAERIAAHGYVTVPVEYRLSVEEPYPAAVFDLKAAVRWLRANAAKYHINPNKFAVYGCSAGGTLAALLGTTGGLKKFEGYGPNADQSTYIQCIVDVDGIVTFTDPADSLNDANPAKPSAASLWFGGTAKEKPELWKEASALYYVDRQTPPVIFINSILDRYHRGRDEMIEKLNELSIYSEVHTIPGTPHPFWLFHPWFEPASERIIAFLNRVLKE
ncbi:MAG: alpha/beta hydrolase fold domain-containing protein [Acidobacteriota bacterium]